MQAWFKKVGKAWEKVQVDLRAVTSASQSGKPKAAPGASGVDQRAVAGRPARIGSGRKPLQGGGAAAEHPSLSDAPGGELSCSR